MLKNKGKKLKGKKFLLKKDSLNFTPGETVEVLDNTDLVRTHYVFAGWNKSSLTGTSVDYTFGDTFLMPSSGVNLYPVWVQAYHVTYFNSYAESGTAPVDTLSPYLPGETVEVLDNIDLVRTGYVFAGWNTSSIVGTTADYTFGDTFLMPSSSVNLYPVWARAYHVTYLSSYADSGTAPVDTLSPYLPGETVEVLDNTNLARTNYVFGGWNKSSLTGTTVDYTFGDTFLMPSSDVNLYPVWVQKYHVNYNYGMSTGGTAPVDALSPYSSGETVEVLDNTNLVRTGYVFAGWNNSSIVGTSVDYTSGDTFLMPSSTVNLYPVWVLKYNVTYHATYATSGTAPVDALSPYRPDETVTVLDNTNLTRTNYAFAGWNKTTYLGQTVDYVSGDDFPMPSSHVNLYPVWVQKYNVTYRSEGSTGGTVPVDTLSPYLPDETVTTAISIEIEITPYRFLLFT